MAAWAQVREVILGSKVNRSAKVDDNLVKVEVMTERGRSQIVYVGNGGDSVTFSSVVCKIEDINLGALFASKAMNSINFGVGPLGEYLAVKHVQQLESLDLVEIASPIAHLALIADALESGITGGDTY